MQVGIAKDHPLICTHPVTVERVSNPFGLRIDKPIEYLDENGIPDWCPLIEDGKKNHEHTEHDTLLRPCHS
jgi:hypothetical protein